MRTQQLRANAARWTYGATLLLVLSLAGCITTPPAENEFWPDAYTGPYTLEPGDQVQTFYTYWPDLNLEQPVRTDGTISLQLVGTVQAAGKTPQELTEELETMYEPHLRDPEITVVAQPLPERRQIFVGGEVNNPTADIVVSGEMTLLSAIMDAGGPNKRTARLTDVVVVRMHEGKQYARSVDVKAMIEDPQSAPFYLQPFDVVYVPRTAIDQVNQWVDQYVNNIVPRNFYATYTWNDQRSEDINTNSRNTNITIPVPGI